MSEEQLAFTGATSKKGCWDLPADDPEIPWDVFYYYRLVAE
jgi:hypothetical protein